MGKKSKLQTPDWILKGKKSSPSVASLKKKPTEKKKQGKTFRVKKCPKCGSTSVSVVLTGEEGKGAREWECKACKWRGRGIEEKELTEQEFLEHMEKMEGK